MKKVLLLTFAALCCTFVFTSCEKDPADSDDGGSVVKTVGATYVTPISAILAGESDENTLARIEEQGFIYSTDPALSYEKDKKLIIYPSYGDGPGIGQQMGHFQGDPTYKAQFGDLLRCLLPGTGYYYCAFVKMDGEVFLGSVKSFTTPALAEPEAVDLGLQSGTRWASCNVGANSPWETGGYYAWGETAEKDLYFKYLHEGEDIGADIAGGDYDAAHVILGGKWSMPTLAQCEELLDGCTAEWTSDYEGKGIGGFVFTSKRNGNSIFLPAAGYINNDALIDAGETCRYWTSNADEAVVEMSSCIHAFRGFQPYLGGCVRSGGSTVRAVLVP